MGELAFEKKEVRKAVNKNKLVGKKFRLIEETKNLILDLDNILKNCPRSEYNIKEVIENDVITMFDYQLQANRCDSKKEKLKYINKIKAKLDSLDFHFERLYIKGIITKKKQESIVRRLLLITKLATGWFKTINGEGS